MKKFRHPALDLMVVGTLLLSPSLVRAGFFQLGPLQAQEVRVQSGEVSSPGSITMVAASVNIYRDWLQALGAYGVAYTANRSSENGVEFRDGRQVAAAGLRYQDAVGVVAGGGIDLAEPVRELQWRENWFLFVGVSWDGFDLDLGDMGLSNDDTP